ncbi:MAG: response regulator transcription factor [Bacteroidota bacterium]
MNCIIIEDQPPAQRVLKKYIQDYGSLQLKATFPDAIQAIDFLKSEDIELIFLDIHLPKMSGFDFLNALPKPPAVILTTAFPDYALESYEFSVVDYLLKPFSFQRFVKAVLKVPDSKTGIMPSARAVRSEIFIKSGYEHIRIQTAQISHIASDADYTELFVAGKRYLSSEPLRHWLEVLDASQFVRIHKSYIVHMAKVQKMAGNQLHLVDGVVVPLGRAYKEAFVERFLK